MIDRTPKEQISDKMTQEIQADRRAEAARAQQMTEQSGLNPVWIATHPDKLIQDRKTGEFYNPQQAFDTMMNKPEIMAVFKRLAVR